MLNNLLVNSHGGWYKKLKNLSTLTIYERNLDDVCSFSALTLLMGSFDL